MTRTQAHACGWLLVIGLALGFLIAPLIFVEPRADAWIAFAGIALGYLVLGVTFLAAYLISR